MTELCRPGFEASLLSGYVDGELTQADSQRVRVHLDECPDCRQQVEEIGRLRAVAAATRFPVPTDDEWNESPRSRSSSLLRRVGWVMVTIWLAVLVWQVAIELIESTGGWLEKALVIGLGGAVLLLFLSVLADRLTALKSDRYRRVLK